MISRHQIKAARGLLEWSLVDLAEKCGLMRDTVTSAENGKHQTRTDTLLIIKQTLEDHGVEFIDNDGVRRRPTSYETLQGPEGLRQFFSNVQQYAASQGGLIVQFGIDEELFLTYLGKDFSDAYVAAMQKTSKERGDLKVKAIVCEGEHEILAPDYNEYRMISREFFQAVPFYIYGNTFAIMDFDTVPSPKITLIKSASVASAYRKQFEAFWQMAKPLENKKSKK